MITLKGVLVRCNNSTSGGRIYPREAMTAAIREYELKIIRSQRKKKIEKINKNNEKTIL